MTGAGALREAPSSLDAATLGNPRGTSRHGRPCSSRHTGPRGASFWRRTRAGARRGSSRPGAEHGFCGIFGAADSWRDSREDRYFWSRRGAGARVCRIPLAGAPGAAGLPVPKPIAARYQRAGFRYRCDLIMLRIADAVPLSAVLAAGRVERRRMACDRRDDRAPAPRRRRPCRSQCTQHPARPRWCGQRHRLRSRPCAPPRRLGLAQFAPAAPFAREGVAAICRPTGSPASGVEKLARRIRDSRIRADGAPSLQRADDGGWRRWLLRPCCAAACAIGAHWTGLRERFGWGPSRGSARASGCMRYRWAR